MDLAWQDLYPTSNLPDGDEPVYTMLIFYVREKFVIYNDD